VDVVHYPSQLKIKLDLDVNERVRYRLEAGAVLGKKAVEKIQNFSL
jgi:hypothetical protein